MQLSNRHGSAVDPAPFLVVALTVAILCFACGPPYLLAAGVGFGPTVAASAVAVLLTWGSYYEFVWAAGGPSDVDRPSGPRLQRIAYTATIAVAIGVGLLLPIL